MLLLYESQLYIMPTAMNPSITNMKVNDSVLKQFVANLILTHNLKLKGWISDVLKSDVLEHKIYEFAVRQAMEYCYYEVVI